ncbi:ATP-binding protein [Actinoallomurus spadix]|uniref:ATP-binding protein n=1 Tax=Actinoallomurus spadix TaxID=79912 RepID=A0ABN0VTR3_9ACTN|nr:ATP-binding protein [Actinoallomurus spadix]MCO5987500.1 ATP-binding protein [Actinoallomurus spadix]
MDTAAMAGPEASGGTPQGQDRSETPEMNVVGAITLPGTERSVADGRRFVRDTLGRGHPAADAVRLSVSELATNAVKHTPSGSGGQITIRLATADNAVRAEVVNDGATGPEPRLPERPEVDAEHGRGLVLIDTVADRWGVTRSTDRTTVWAEFSY